MAEYRQSFLTPHPTATRTYHGIPWAIFQIVALSLPGSIDRYGLRRLARETGIPLSRILRMREGLQHDPISYRVRLWELGIVMERVGWRLSIECQSAPPTAL